MADSARVKRLAGEIGQKLALLIQSKMNDRRLGMVTITDVKVSKDLGYADIYVTFLVAGDEKMSNAERVAILCKASGFLRSELSRQISVRSMPLLRFHFDEVSERGAHLDQLIQQIRSTRLSSD